MSKVVNKIASNGDTRIVGLIFPWVYFGVKIVVGMFAAFWENLPWGEVEIFRYYIAIVLSSLVNSDKL